MSGQDHRPLMEGLRGPLVVVTLPGFYRLPPDRREEIEDTVRRANAMV